MNTIVVAVIVLVALAVILFVFANLYGKSAGDLSCTTFFLSHDDDNDGVKDAADPCACDGEVPRLCDGSKEQSKKCSDRTQCKDATECNNNLNTKCKASKGK